MQYTGERSGIRRPAAHPLRTACGALVLIALSGLCAALTSCSRHLQDDKDRVAPPALLHQVDLTTPTDPLVLDGPVALSSARNESIDVVIQVDAKTIAQHRWLRTTPAHSTAGNDVRVAVATYQVLSAPV